MLVLDFMWQMSLQTLTKLFQKTSIQILLITLLTVITYSNILQNGLSFDDRDFLLNWPVVRDSQNGLSAFLSLPDLLAGELPSHHRGVYRPIRSVYYLFSLKLWGLNPFAFHLQAIIVHLLITITIYFLVKLLIKDMIPKAKILPFLTAMLFATHPIHTEAVTYTAASFDTLGILFFFASFYFYCEAGASTHLKAGPAKSKQGITRFLSWVFAFLAFFTYEMTLALPLLIIIYEICFKKLTFKNFLKKFTLCLPYLLIILGYLIVRFYLLKIGNRGDYLGPAYLPASNQAKLGILEILIRYIGLLVFPLNLTVTYPTPDYLFSVFYKIVTQISPNGYLLQKIGEYVILLPLIVVCLLVVLTLRIFKNRTVAFSISWFFLSLLPVLNILPQGAVSAERFLYIPSFGFCLLIGLGIYKIAALKIMITPAKTWIIASGLIFTLIISLYSIRTIIRNFDWKDMDSIFLAANKLEPKGFMANAALGSIKLEQNQLDESIQYSRRALEVNPDDSHIHHQLGLAYEKNGELEKALSEYQVSLKLEPDYYYANIGLGNIYEKQGKLEEAVSEYKKALAHDGANIDALFNLAGVYTEKKMYPEALKEYQEVVKINPAGAAAYSNIAYIYTLENNLDNATSEYKKAIELEPDNFHFHSNLGSVFEKKGDKKAALEEYKKALSLNPDDKSLQQKIKELEAN